MPGITYIPDLIMNFAGETVASWLNHMGLGSQLLDLIFWGMTCSDGLEIPNSPHSPQSHQSHHILIKNFVPGHAKDRTVSLVKKIESN